MTSLLLTLLLALTAAATPTTPSLIPRIPSPIAAAPTTYPTLASLTITTYDGESCHGNHTGKNIEVA